MMMGWQSLLSHAENIMSVQEAYEAIPHRRTIFDASYTKMSKEEETYLVQLFQLVDMAIVERVRILLLLNAPQEVEKGIDHYDEIFINFNSLQVPESLQEVHQLILTAIKEQREFLEEWLQSDNFSSSKVASHPLVKSSSQRLHQAYALLLSLYPNEDQHNKDAFFDYLCALDFI